MTDEQNVLVAVVLQGFDKRQEAILDIQKTFPTLRFICVVMSESPILEILAVQPPALLIRLVFEDPAIVFA
jgi:hypothetical protein